MAVAHDGRTYLTQRGAGQLALGLAGQKKRTSSGSVRRWPNLRTRSSSERPDRRSEGRNLVSFIRDRQALAALSATTGKHPASVLGGHPLAKTVAIAAAAARWLVSSLHGSNYPFISILFLTLQANLKNRQIELFWQPLVYRFF